MKKNKPSPKKDGRGRPKTRTLESVKIPNATPEKVAKVLFYRADKGKRK